MQCLWTKRTGKFSPTYRFIISIDFISCDFDAREKQISKRTVRGSGPQKFLLRKRRGQASHENVPGGHGFVHDEKVDVSGMRSRGKSLQKSDYNSSASRPSSRMSWQLSDNVGDQSEGDVSYANESSQIKGAPKGLRYRSGEPLAVNDLVVRIRGDRFMHNGKAANFLPWNCLADSVPRRS